MLIKALRQIHWHARLNTSLATLMILSILCFLGQWQLKRAAYKDSLYHAFYNNQPFIIKPSSLLNSQSLPRYHYQRIELKGHFDNTKTFLQDNQIVQNQIGYYLFTPFYINAIKHWILVNRGFLPRLANKKRLDSYALPPLRSPHTIRIIINSYPKTAILLGKNIETMSDGRYLVQDLRIPSLKSSLNLRLVEATGLLTRPKETFTRNWKPNITVSATRHRAYAFQWFSMAIILVIIYLALNCSIRKSK